MHPLLLKYSTLELCSGGVIDELDFKNCYYHNFNSGNF